MRRDIRIVRGESEGWTGVLRDGNGDRVDLTNLTLTWKAGDKDFRRTVIELSEGNGITITNATRGEWRIDLVKSNTEELSEGLYRHQGFAAGSGGTNLLFTNGRLDLAGDIR